MTSSAQPIGTVVAAYGRRGILDTGSERRPYLAKGRRLRVVCGDRVLFEHPPGSAELLVTAIAPRVNALTRCTERNDDEVVAANLTQLIAVCAPQPEPDSFLLDRYLCAAEIMGCRAAIAWNKCDLNLPAPPALDELRKLGYPILRISTKTGDGLPDLRRIMAGETSIFVGQSGVGKSSLINALTPGAQAAVGELSAGRLTGTHTTTASLMYAVNDGGWLVDTPGVRDFTPAFGKTRIDHGFPELRRLTAGCRFTDCRHLHEPGCAVKDSLATGTLSARRYASYQRLLQMIAERQA